MIIKSLFIMNVVLLVASASESNHSLMFNPATTGSFISVVATSQLNHSTTVNHETQATVLIQLGDMAGSGVITLNRSALSKVTGRGSSTLNVSSLIYATEAPFTAASITLGNYSRIANSTPIAPTESAVRSTSRPASSISTGIDFGNGGARRHPSARIWLWTLLGLLVV